MEELLKNISSKDLEKLKMLFSIIPGNETKEVVTLRVFEDEYSNLIKQNRSRAYHLSVNSSFKHLTDYFGKQRAIQEIGLKETENFCSHLQQTVHKGFRVYYRTLKAAFNKAVEWGYVKENYFNKVKLPKRQKVVPVFITSDQLSAISGQIKNIVVKDFVVFAFYTGMRLDEIINLCWKNVDLENRVITIGDENFITKGRNQRFIPICEEALGVIENIESVINKADRFRMQPATAYKNEKQNDNAKIRVIKLVGDASSSSSADPSRGSGHGSELRLGIKKGYVFCKKDGSKYCGNYVSRKFKDACIAAGVDNAIHFHSLRHSVASNLVEKGVPLYTRKELLGHSSISTTEIYSHLNMETLREAIKKLDMRQNQKSNHEGNSQLKIFRINVGDK